MGTMKMGLENRSSKGLRMGKILRVVMSCVQLKVEGRSCMVGRSVVRWIARALWRCGVPVFMTIMQVLSINATCRCGRWRHS